MSVKLLVDGDVYAYRAGFATDKTKYLVTNEHGAAEYDNHKEAKASAEKNGTIIWSRKASEPENKALMLVDVMLGDLRAHYQAENPTVAVYITGVGNFRHSVATRASYKGNRSGSVPPVHIKAIRAHLVSKHNATTSFNEEADDVIAVQKSLHPGAIIVSQDKDFFQIPGRIYNPVTKEETTVTQKEAVLNFYSQVISGDPTDNIIGATGYGPVKARKVLEGCRNPFECWQTALAIYVKEWGDIAGPLYALECARLVKLGHSLDNLWEPPSATKAQQAA